MFKKISAIILTLVLCLSVMMVPVSGAAELNGTQVAYALEWDKEYYNAGDTATLYLYLAVQEDIALYTGTITIGLNSAFISPDDNDPGSCIAGSELCESYYKPLADNTVQSTSTYQTRIEGKNTADENATYDWYIRTSLNKNVAGDHANAGNNKDGLYGSEIDPTVPFVTYTFTVAADAADGSVIPAAITSGCATCSPAQLQFKYYKTPGTGTGTANIAADQYDVSNAIASATVGVEPCDPADHVWDNGEVTKDPTCGKDGERTFTCTVCKSTKTDVEPATGKHTPAEAVVENEVPASCNTAGSYDSVIYCSVCEKELERTSETSAPTGQHNYATLKESKAPTCTEDGYEIYACGCGAEETTTIDKLDHKNEDGTSALEEIPAVDATCTTDGSTAGEKCTICDEVLTTPTTITALGHTAEDAVKENEVAATCTTDGSYDEVIYCSVCDDEISRDTVTVSSLGHTAEDAVKENEVAATCTTDGSYDEVIYCSVCDDEISRETVTDSSLDHKKVDGSSELVEIPAVDATCTTDGSTAGERCTICDAVTVSPEQVQKLGHSWDDGVVTEPTYTSGGYTTYTCEVCGETKRENEVPALAPVYTFAIREPAVTKLRFMDEMVLHADITGNAPEGSYVVWEATEGAEFFTVMEDNGDGKLRITPKNEGFTTFKATLYDAQGNELATEEIEMFSRAHLFDKIGGIIRYIFGSNIKYEK